MHVDNCPKCGRPGYLIKTFRRIEGQPYGPYPTVRHYVSKTRVKQCYLSLKKLHPADEARIIRLLLEREKARK